MLSFLVHKHKSGHGKFTEQALGSLLQHTNIVGSSQASLARSNSTKFSLGYKLLEQIQEALLEHPKTDDDHHGERIFLIAVSHLLWDLGRVSFTSEGWMLPMVAPRLCRARGCLQG